MESRSRTTPFQNGQLLSQHKVFKDEIPAVTEDSKERPEREPEHVEHTPIYNKGAGIGSAAKLLISALARVLARHRTDRPLKIRPDAHDNVGAKENSVGRHRQHEPFCYSRRTNQGLGLHRGRGSVYLSRGSGYFTLRQFRAFTGSHAGKRPTSFAQKLLEKGHARACAQVRTAALFHLFSRKVYGEMHKDNLRNRKRHSFEFTRTRLVLLDFVLANLEYTYFETEQEKVDFFCNKLRISLDSLPAKVYESTSPDQQTIRYFVDKFPLFLSPPLLGLPPVVTFSYIDSGFERPFNFASHLATCRSLFQQLSSFRFVYVAAKEAYFQGAEEKFRSVVRRPLEKDISGEIARYFRIRKKWENHEYIIPVTADLAFLSEARRRFHEERIERHLCCFRACRVDRILHLKICCTVSAQKDG